MTPQIFSERDRQPTVTTLMLAIVLIAVVTVVVFVAINATHLGIAAGSSPANRGVEIAPPQTADQYEVTSLEGTGLTYVQNGTQFRWIFTTSSLSAQTTLVKDFPLPPVADLLRANLQFTGQGAALPPNTVFFASHSETNEGAGSFFTDGHSLFFMLWVAGDCTPRVFNGIGGYWQMPTPPQFTRDAQQEGFLIHLPENWQQSWYRNPSAASPWRLCATHPG